MKKLKAGINKPIICKKCGHKIGYLRLKPKLNKRTLVYILWIALITQIISEIIGRIVFGDYKAWF